MTEYYTKVENCLTNEPVVIDIIAEYNKTLTQLNEVNDLIAGFDEDAKSNLELEGKCKSIVGKVEENPDVLKDDEDLGF